MTRNLFRAVKMLTRTLTLSLAICAFLVVPASAADAPQPPPSQTKDKPGEFKPKKSKKERDNVLETKAAREQRVAVFVKQQNPELEKLLAHLKQHKTEQYDQAVSELGHSATVLAEVKARDPQLYEIELRAWQAKTKIQLLQAQAMISDQAGLEAKLRQAIREEIQVKADELTYRRDKTTAGYNRQIQRLEENREQLIESRLKKLLAKPKPEGASKPKRSKKTG